tara:strand:+ start:20884 stop:21606 length:723 start_codon:yes stop_codon:yes gene_type:complete
MKALILAAGMGTRLKEHTTNIPKCLVPVKGRPILEIQLDALLANGITEVVLVTGYKSEKIVEFLGASTKFKDINFTLIENKEYATSNSGYSFWLAREELRDKPYLHLNCDIIINSEVIAALLKKPHQDVLSIDRGENAESMEKVILDEQNKIIAMEKYDLSVYSGKVVGLAKFSATTTNWILGHLARYINAGEKNQNCFGMLRHFVHSQDLYAFEITNFNVNEINTVAGLDKVHNEGNYI